MLPYFTERFGNAASHNHVFGWQAAEAVKFSREQVATLIGAEPGEIIFTSGATEADNLALKGVFETYASKGNHIITCNIEHRAVLDPCKHLEKQGAEVTYLGVSNDGLVDLRELEAAFKPTTILVAIMFANITLRNAGFAPFFVLSEHKKEFNTVVAQAMTIETQPLVNAIYKTIKREMEALAR